MATLGPYSSHIFFKISSSRRENAYAIPPHNFRIEKEQAHGKNEQKPFGVLTESSLLCFRCVRGATCCHSRSFAVRSAGAPAGVPAASSAAFAIAASRALLKARGNVCAISSAVSFSFSIDTSASASNAASTAATLLSWSSVTNPRRAV